ncbi:MAG: YciI family protein [Candidatus Neomarinimicrobiota bacterium]
MNDNSKYVRYVILINKQKNYSIELIKRHIEHLKKLEKNDQLVLCGPFKDYNGGIIIIKAETFAEANNIAESDPYITEKFSTYELRILELSNAENNHMGMG